MTHPPAVNQSQAMEVHIKEDMNLTSMEDHLLPESE